MPGFVALQYEGREVESDLPELASRTATNTPPSAPSPISPRLGEKAEGGEVVISQRVFNMLDGGVQAEHVGEIEFKGIAQPVPSYLVKKLSGWSSSSS